MYDGARKSGIEGEDLSDYLTEQEQIELLKNWIKQYSLVILAGVVIAVLAMTGWRYWQQRQATLYSHASAVYDEMLTARAQNEPATTTIQTQKLFTHYPTTTYAQFAALMMARDAIIKRNYPEAEKHLRWVLDHSRIASLRQIARLRLARLYIAQHQSNKAIDILLKVDDKNFNGLINEVRGDAFLEANNTTMAREAYQQALTDLPDAETIRPLLQMKFDNLASA
jgi:predicted negative regulator of RcsB-dependent stress response